MPEACLGNFGCQWHIRDLQFGSFRPNGQVAAFGWQPTRGIQPIAEPTPADSVRLEAAATRRLNPVYWHRVSFCRFTVFSQCLLNGLTKRQKCPILRQTDPPVSRISEVWQGLFRIGCRSGCRNTFRNPLAELTMITGLRRSGAQKGKPHTRTVLFKLARHASVKV